MKKGYQKILTTFEKEFPAEMSISGIRKFLPNINEQNLLELTEAGFLDKLNYSKDKFGDHLHKISSEGFSHLVGLRTYHMTKATKKLTDWIKILTVGLLVIGTTQIIFTIMQYYK